jgi:hypothetical protein
MIDKEGNSMRHSASVVLTKAFQSPGAYCWRSVSGIFKLVLAASVTVLAIPGIGLGQTATTAIITGSVTDPAGASLAGAQIELINPATNQTQKQTTNESGQYIFSQVPPGQYKLTATKEGFRQAIVPLLKVDVSKSYTVDFKLEVGDVVETIEVAAGVGVELQKTDSTVGNVIPGRVLPYFPTVTRLANELLNLQPLTTPGGAVAGARSDQSTFLLDGIDVTNQSVGGTATYARLPVDGVEEFRVGVANPNATFGRGAGGQVSIISRRGSNEFHGAAYWYHQNDNLNANSWTNNRTRIRRAEEKDNRFGFTAGGPVLPWRDKAFFFLNYEGRRFPNSASVLRLVPTDTLRQGILRFQDSSRNVVSYNLAMSSLCGPSGDQPCDPRALGLSPTISALWSRLPAGNDPSSGDGLNTTGFRGNVSVPLDNDFYNARFDYNLTSNWRLDAAFRYFGELQSGSGLASIIGGNVESREKFPNRQNMLNVGLTGNLTPNLTGEFRFGWVRVRTATDRFRPNASAAFLDIPGTRTSAGHIALDLGALGGTQSLLAEPIDVGTQVARKQANDNRNFQYNADMNWVKANHTFQFGGHLRYLPTLHLRDDKVVGSLGALVAQIDSDLGSGVTIPASARPRTCSSTVTTNCLTAADVRQWNRLYASALGIVDNISVMAVWDGNFKPLPFGELLEADTKLYAPEFYFQDVWRIRPSLTLTYGVNYGWQTAPTEKLGRQSIQADGLTLQEQTADGYLSARAGAARAGRIFNPPIAFLPINSAERNGVFDIDWDNVGPRFAVAWNPSFSNRVLGWLFGNRKTVIRGGYSLVYDRQNTVQSVIVPTLGVAFAQTINVTGPRCNSTGAGGRACDPANSNPALGGFRVGVDGNIPVPTVPERSIPVSPFWGVDSSGRLQLFPEVLSFQVDPQIEVGENHAFDLTWQREFPGNMLLEAGYVGRWASKLPQSMSFGQVPYIHVDSASRQTFAQAFDAVASQLRSGVTAANVTAQPWFENQFPALGTQAGGTRALAALQTSNFINGNLNNIFLTVDQRRMLAGLQPFNNYLAQTLFLRSSTGSSNYNALFVTLQKRMSQGLLYTINYTFSKSLDQFGVIQNAASVMPNNFDLNAEYGPSPFDVRHLFNATWLYELPFGPGRFFDTGIGPLNKVVGGWFMSGIFTARSGDPLTVNQGAGVWGGSLFLGFNSGAIPTVDPNTFSNTVNSGINGSNNIGTNGNPASGGSGLSLFPNPEQVFNSFRRVLVSQDTRAGRSTPLYGLPRWDLNLSVGKRTTLTEDVNMVFAFDFFNIFNHVDFNNPSLDLNNSRAFGVITSQGNTPRRIQFGLRVEF